MNRETVCQIIRRNIVNVEICVSHDVNINKVKRHDKKPRAQRYLQIQSLI